MDTKKKSREETKIAFQFIPSEFTLNQIGLSSALSNENDVRRLITRFLMTRSAKMKPAEHLLENYLFDLLSHLKSLRESELLQLQSKLDF